MNNRIRRAYEKIDRWHEELWLSESPCYHIMTVFESELNIYLKDAAREHAKARRRMMLC